jgi:hypothetical protein
MNWRRLNVYVGLITLILAVILILEGSAQARWYNLTKYFPLREGITWNYLQVYSDGSKNYEVFCIGGTEVVHGEKTRKHWQFDSGELEYYDYDHRCRAWTIQGLKYYKHVYGDDYYVMFDPPAIQFPRRMRLGDTFEHTGTWTYYDPDGNVVDTGPYTLEHTLEAEEDITVIAGSFTQCLKFSVREDDWAPGWWESTIWLAPRIGEVKVVSTDTDEYRELLSFTNGLKTYYPGD